MFKELLSLILVGAAGLTWMATGAAASDKADKANMQADKADMQAKEATEQFMKAMKAEDIEAVMKIAEVPFFWDGKKNIKDREELKKEFTSVFGEKDLTQIEYDIKEVHTFENLPKGLNDKDRELLKEVLEKADRIVIVIVAVKKESITVMVRIREGKPKVAGFRD